MMERLNGIFDLVIDKIIGWLERIVLLLPNVVVSLVVLVLGFWVAKRLTLTTGKLLEKYSDRKILNNMVVTIMHMSVIGLVIFTALSILNLDKAVTSILAGVGILSLGLAFAFQDIATNFMSGVMISIRRPVKVGDLIELKETRGVVYEVNLRDTVVTTLQGKKVIIPNKDILQSVLINHSQNPKQRLDLEVGVSYGEDLERVKQVTMEAVAQLKNRTEDPIQLFYTKFDSSSINFVVFIWLEKPDWGVFLEARSEAVMRIKKAFDDHGITIPFPIRTLDFGIKGGQKLSEMVVQTSATDAPGS